VENVDKWIWWIVAFLMLSMWAFGFVSSYMLGGLIHVLLLLALVALLAPFVGNRRSM